VKHGTNKKRRRGGKVTRKAKKHIHLRVEAKIPQIVKDEWDRSKTPAENLASFGLEHDMNKGIGRKRDRKPTDGSVKSAAFVGMMEVPRDDFKEHNPLLKKLAETDQKYAVALIKAHGDNYAKMARDIKVNVNQLTELKCKKLCEKFFSLSDEERIVTL